MECGWGADNEKRGPVGNAPGGGGGGAIPSEGSEFALSANGLGAHQCLNAAQFAFDLGSGHAPQVEVYRFRLASNGF
jgi:hypothetical protein